MNPAALLDPRGFRKANGTDDNSLSSAPSQLQFPSHESPEPLPHSSREYSPSDLFLYSDDLSLPEYGTLDVPSSFTEPEVTNEEGSAKKSASKSDKDAATESPSKVDKIASLLDPQAAATKRVKSAKASEKSRNQSQAPDSHMYVQPLPKITASSLLAPRDAKHSIAPASTVNTSESYGTVDAQPVGSNTASMIERLHGIEKREEQPRKRLANYLDPGEHSHKKSKFGDPNSSIVGKYLTKGNEEEAGSVFVAAPSNAYTSTPTTLRPSNALPLVDLTEGDDDDVIFVSDDNDKEFYFGNLDPPPTVTAYQIPRPSGKTGAESTMWLPMKITFRQRPNLPILMAVDPSGTEFGRLDPRSTGAISSFMEARGTGIRFEARTLPRRRRKGEQGGDTLYSDEVLTIKIRIFAPKKMATLLVNSLGKRSMFLKQPQTLDAKVEFLDPYDPYKRNISVAHQPYLPSISASSAMFAAQGMADRTAEEVTADVTNMFDSIIKSESLPEMEQDWRIKTPLLGHQKQALYFMTERENDQHSDEMNVNRSLWKTRMQGNGIEVYYHVITGHESRDQPEPILGGILADMMGLGKTLSVLSLITSTIEKASEWAKGLAPGSTLHRTRATLLICPLSVVANWEQQIKEHIKPGTLKWCTYHGSNRTKDVPHLAGHDLVLTTYSTVASDSNSLRIKVKPLSEIEWFRVVLDESHQIRNASTLQSKAACALSAERRWAVTGTPVQNRLDDLGALLKFLRVRPFDDKWIFENFIIKPLKKANENVLANLRLLVDSITLRRTKDRITLPPRHDLIVRLPFSETEWPIYSHFHEEAKRQITAMTDAAAAGKKQSIGGHGYAHVLKTILRMRLLCAHGTELLGEDDMRLLQGLSYSNAIDLGDDDDEDTPALTPKQAFEMWRLLQSAGQDSCHLCTRKLAPEEDEDLSDDEGAGRTVAYMTPCYQVICPKCIAAFKAELDLKKRSDGYVNCPLCEQYIRASLFELKQNDLDKEEAERLKIRKNPKLAKQMGRYGGPHTKTKALLEELSKSRAWGDANPGEAPIKSVVFSGWTSHLDLIQIALDTHDFKTCRLDGSMSRSQRTMALKTFAEDPNVPIMLVSIAAGGLGLNLTTANKVYVMEPQYNPAAEAQAVDRVHRIGQPREVTVTKFIMDGSFEERMLKLQKKKTALASLTVGGNDKKLSKAELATQRMEDLKALFE